MSIIEKFIDKIGGNIDKTRDESAHNLDQNTSHAASKATGLGTDNDFDTFEQSNLAVKKQAENKTANKESGNRIVIDLDKLNKLGYLTPNTENNMLFEQLRHIKLDLLARAFNKDIEVGKNRNVVMVSSALEGEGKTFISLNLALAAAYEFNTTVLYIDADVFKRESSKIVGLDGVPGLTDYLSDTSIELPKLMHKSNISTLNIISCGKVTDRVTELYSSDRMQSLINELSRRYNDRLIILDSPPLLADSSTIALAKIVDQVLVVVEAEKTNHNNIREALHKIKVKDNISFILNKSNQRYSRDSYYYSYR